MLIQYSVENFKSIKDEVIINFTASKKYYGDEWATYIDLPEYHLYKGLGLVGPNASGKSNIIDSFYFAVKFVKNTISRKEKAKIKIQPFRLSDDKKNENSNFEFIYLQEGIKYVYGFGINSKRVEEEYLMAYFSSKPTTIFERKNCREYNFKGKDIKIQQSICEKTNDNRLYMPVAAEWGFEKVSQAYAWFEKSLNQYEDVSLSGIVESIIDNKEKKNILLESLRKADFNISDIYVKNEKIEFAQMDTLKQLMVQLIPDLDVETMSENTTEIYVTHVNDNGDKFSINLINDSAGTEKIVNNLSELLFLSDSGGVMLEDELGKVYHTKLTQHLLKLVSSNRSNPGSVQLFFATHDTKILNFINPEQVYLVDKDDEGATIVKLLDDYIIRDKDNIELGYLKGRYGAVPYTKE